MQRPLGKTIWAQVTNWKESPGTFFPTVPSRTSPTVWHACCPRLRTPPVQSTGWSTQRMCRKACSYDMNMLHITVFATRKSLLVCLICIQEAMWLAKVRQRYRNPSVLSRMLCCRAILKHLWQVVPAVPTSSTPLPPGSLHSSGRKISFKLAFSLWHIISQFPSFLLSQASGGSASKRKRQACSRSHRHLEPLPLSGPAWLGIFQPLAQMIRGHWGNIKDELISISSGLEPF